MMLTHSYIHDNKRENARTSLVTVVLSISSLEMQGKIDRAG